MSYKSLQRLRDEQQAHHNRALRLFEEAAEIFQELKYMTSPAEYKDLQERWLEKDAQARAEIKKSVELTQQFIRELERLKNRNLN